jgi:hypothetical protein
MGEIAIRQRQVAEFISRVFLVYNFSFRLSRRANESISTESVALGAQLCLLRWAIAVTSQNGTAKRDFTRAGSKLAKG